MMCSDLQKAPVSVIIPCYRCANTIKRALDSIMAQTLLPEEIILVDDFSNDQNETVALLESLKNLYYKTNIKIVQLDNTLLMTYSKVATLLTSTDNCTGRED